MYSAHWRQAVFFFMSMFIMGSSIQAQVTMSLQLAPTGLVQRNQLWNMVLVNANATPVTVYISLKLLTARDNRPVMTAITQSILLNKGAKQLNAAALAPIQYNYITAFVNADAGADGLITVGNYKACYTVFKANEESVVPLAEDCIPLEVQPLSPPMLNIPPDHDTTVSAYPQFTWLPATPAQVFTHQNYDMLLVEVLPGQTKGDAIQKNLPVYHARNIDMPFINYPAANKGLESNRLYAWKVIAKNVDDPVAQTDIWTFTVNGARKLPVATQREAYMVLNDDLRGLYQLKGDTLQVKYFSYDNTYTSAISFTNRRGEVIYQEEKEIIRGDNYLLFKLSPTLQPGSIYQLRLRSPNGKPHILHFTIVKK